MKSNSQKDIRKAARERAVFEDFLRKAILPPESERIESREPPEPDILYRGPNETIAFELAEICASDIAKLVTELQNCGGVQIGFTPTRDPTPEIIRTKFSKSYHSPHPVELICCTGRTVSPDDQIAAEIVFLVGMADGLQFRRVWLLGDELHCIWCKQ